MIASKSVNSQIKCSWETVERHLAVGKLESKRAGENVLSSTGSPLFKNRTWSKAQSAPPLRHNNPTVCICILWQVHTQKQIQTPEHLTWEGRPCHDGSMAMVSSNLQYHDFHRSLKCQMENEISDNTIVVHSGKISDVAVLKLKLLWCFPLLFLPGGHYWKINRGS